MLETIFLLSTETYLLSPVYVKNFVFLMIVTTTFIWNKLVESNFNKPVTPHCAKIILGRFETGISGVRKVEAFLQPCSWCIFLFKSPASLFYPLKGKYEKHICSGIILKTNTRDDKNTIQFTDWSFIRGEDIWIKQYQDNCFKIRKVTAYIYLFLQTAFGHQIFSAKEQDFQ